VVDALQASQLTPAAVELGMGEAITLSVCAEGIADALERHVRDASKMMQASDAIGLAVLRDEAHTAHWRAINDASQLLALGPDELVLKLTCLPAHMQSLLAALAERANALGLKLACTARALSGVAYARVRGPAEGLIGLHRALLAQHPRIVLLGAPREVRMQVPIWGNAIAGLDIMQRIKREFDPHNVLNPGRFVV
jgi:glycolate oxidase FAD binding subunit